MPKVEEKVFLVTGVGQNMGMAVAQRLAAKGARVAISDLRAEVLDGAAGVVEAASRQSRSAARQERDGASSTLALEGDIRRAADCEGLVAKVIETFGRIDVLVNCAGRSSFGPALEMDEALFDQEIETNLKGNFLIARAAGRALVAQGEGGRIILFSSGAGESARRGGVSHCASKAGVNMVVRVLAIELGEHNITVNAISPGLVPKPGHVSTQEYREAVLRNVPLNRLGRPEDVGGAVEFLASDDAGWISGEILHVDGGSLAGRAHLPWSVSKPRSSF